MSIGPSESAIICLLGIILILVPMLLANAIRIVPEGKRLSVLRLGRFIGEKGPGLVFLIPVLDRGVVVDLSDQLKRVNAQKELFNAIGETRTHIHSDGSVDVGGVTWSAVSKVPIPPGRRVRINKIILEVEEF